MLDPSLALEISVGCAPTLSIFSPVKRARNLISFQKKGGKADNLQKLRSEPSQCECIGMGCRHLISFSLCVHAYLLKKIKMPLLINKVKNKHENASFRPQPFSSHLDNHEGEYVFFVGLPFHP